MNIDGVQVGPGNPCYVIAEIGSNHDGSLDRARELIQAAADAGADAAKFQLYRAETLYPGTHTPGAIPDAWLPELKACCHEAGVEFLCSVFCRETLAAYMRVRPAAIKIASPEATDRDLLRAACHYHVPLIVSTGAMTTLQLIDMRLVLFGASFALLHCVSAYPAPLDQLNLRVIPRMVKRFDVPVGFSDHSIGIDAAPIAVALGACIVEKHLTHDREAAGPDHPFALEPAEFAAMVEAIRAAESMLGDGVKRVQASEDPTDRREAA